MTSKAANGRRKIVVTYLNRNKLLFVSKTSFIVITSTIAKSCCTKKTKRNEAPKTKTKTNDE